MTPATPQASWLDTLKDSLRLDVIKAKFYELQPTLIELGLCLGIGFLVGFILKKFGKFFAIIVGALVILGILQQLGFIVLSINWLKMQELFGVHAIPTLDTPTLTLYLDWVKEHVMNVLLFVLGFLMGLRLA